MPAWSGCQMVTNWVEVGPRANLRVTHSIGADYTSKNKGLLHLWSLKRLILPRAVSSTVQVKVREGTSDI